jgi:hypothetical protein
MSAWYVLSSIGLYKVTPGSTFWETVTPYFENIKIHVENGKTINIKNEQNIINWISETVVPEPRKLKEIVIVPVIHSEKRFFEKQQNISIESYQKNKIYFSINGSDFKEYKQELTLTETSTITTFAENNKGEKSGMVTAKFYKKPNNYSIEIKSKANPQYFAGGKEGLIDGISGDANWRKGDWHGYQSQDFEAIIDLKESKEISNISADFLQDTRAWILMPTKVEFYISEDNVNFKKLGEVLNPIDAQDYNVQTKNLELHFAKTKAKYVKIIARNFGKLPSWHQGFPFDGEAFIFIDEITIL